MITQEEKDQQNTKHVCFCELCMPVIDSMPIARKSQEETAPEQKPEAVVALAA